MATILSAAMLLRYSLNLEKEAQIIEKAVSLVIENGYRTPDLMEDGCKAVSTVEMGDLVVNAIRSL